MSPSLATPPCSDVYQAAPVTSPTSSTPGWRRTQLTTCTATFFVQTEARKYYANHSPFFEQFQHANYHYLTYCVTQHGRILLVSHGWVIFAVAHLEGPQLPTREAGKLMHDDSEAVWAVQDGDPNFLHPVGWRTPQDHEVSTDYFLELFLELSYFYSPLSLW